MDPVLPKQGGGVDAFRTGEARIPGQQDEDEDGLTSGWFGGQDSRASQKKLRWNRFKWILFVANSFVGAGPSTRIHHH